MGTISDKLTYLDTTKTQIKNAINNVGANITNDTFRSYANTLNTKITKIHSDRDVLIGNNVIGTSTGLITTALDYPIYEDKMSKLSTQDGTPTPSNPVEVKTVKGYRNLFDKNNANIIYTNITSTTLNSNVNTKTLYISITGGKIYKIYKTLSYRFRVGTTAETPVAGGSVIDFIANDTSTATIIETSQTANYLCVYYFLLGSETLTEQQILNSIMITEGSKELPYVPYGTNYISTSIKSKNLLEITDSNLLVRCSYVSGANTNEYKLLCTQADMYVNEVASTGTYYSKSRQGNLIACSYGETIYYDLGNELFNKNYFTEFDEDLVSLGNYSKQSSSGNYTPTNASCKYVTLRFGYGSNAVPETTYTLAPIICKYIDTTYDTYKENIITIPLNNNEIAGIGDYKDELIVDKNGHCWLNKQTGKINSYNGETITTDYLSTTGGLDIGTTIYYVLDTPTLIDLNYNVDLTLYEGTNTITNSEDMDMAIKYVEDINTILATLTTPSINGGN